MTKVEQVARAIYGTTALSQTTPQWERVRYELKDLFLHQAQVAIEAMKNPSEAVTFAAFEFLDGSYSHERITLAWNAGIDAALAEDPV